MHFRSTAGSECGNPRVVLIYRDELLKGSETFIRAQAEALRSFTPHYVGSKVCSGQALPAGRVHLVHGGGRFGRFRDLTFKATGHLAGTVVRTLTRLNPALVHAHFGPDGVTAMPLARTLGVPLVVTFHGFDATVRDADALRSFPRHRVYIVRRRSLMSAGARFLAVSHFIKGRLLAQGFPGERVVVHYTGVDLHRFRGDPAAAREPVVLFVGRMVEGKGGSHLLHAMALVHARQPTVRVVLIGDGPERDEWELMARQTGVAAEFLGERPPEDVQQWLQRAAVLCVPSITTASGAQEGFGMVFAEALASGLPVVSHAVGGIPEAVGEGVGGLLVPEGDDAGLAHALERVLSDPDLRVALGRAGQSRVHALFDLRRQTERLEGVYQDLVVGPCLSGSSLPVQGGVGAVVRAGIA
jgi:colanic acid/amylovoran biosynthesis glycosyltransferase